MQFSHLLAQRTPLHKDPQKTEPLGRESSLCVGSSSLLSPSGRGGWAPEMPPLPKCHPPLTAISGVSSVRREELAKGNPPPAVSHKHLPRTQTEAHSSP